jgi:signal transduction histidine kinase
MKPALRTQLLLAAPGVALAAAVLAGHQADRLVNAAQAALGLIVVWTVAGAVHLRYPDRPLGRLLFALAVGYALLALQASDHPALFTLGRATRPLMEVLLVWTMLAFPSGRLAGRLERSLVIGAAAAVLVLWLPSAMLTSQIPMAGPLVMCQPDCPRNALFIVERPDLARYFSFAFRVVGTLVLLATAAVLFHRLRGATPSMRRVLAPVLLASMARAMVVAAFLVGSGSWLAFAATFFAVPLAIALGLLRGRLFTARALQRLVSGLRGRPDMHDLRGVMADALGDPSLMMAYWLKESEQWVDAEGQPVSLPYPSAGRGRAVTQVRDAAGLPVAALVHDVALLEEPTLVESVASSMQVALESHRLEAELKASSARAATAVEQERHRIERDLHDGAQQRLIALRMKLSVTARLLDQDPRRAAALVQEMGGDVEAAIAELRSYAHGIVPPLLHERGLAFALAEAAQRAPIPTRADIGAIGRFDPGIERAVYFCCLEALQNAAKHGGPEANACLMLRREGDMLNFSVDDDGRPEPGAPRASGGQGLINMRERIAAVGGQLAVTVRPEGGFQVAGSVYVGAGTTNPSPGR